MDIYFTSKVKSEYPIYSSEELPKKLEPILTEFLALMKAKFGGRKQKFTLTYDVFGKQYKVEINKNYSVRTIYQMMIAEFIWQNYRYARNVYRYNFTYSMEHARQEKLSRINGFTLVNEIIIFTIGEDTTLPRKQMIVDEFSKFIALEKAEQERVKLIEPDFTNYLDHSPSKVDMSLINEYIDLLEKYKDDIKLDYYKQYNVNLERGSYLSQFGGKFENLRESLISLIEKTIKSEQDIIGIIPTISEFSAERFLETDLLSFKFIYNDNRVAVNKHIREEEGRAIAEYYASKPSGSYVGD